MNAENSFLTPGSSAFDRVGSDGCALTQGEGETYEFDVFGSLRRKAIIAMVRDERKINTEIAEFEKRQAEFNEQLSIANGKFAEAKIAYEERKRDFEQKRLAWLELKKRQKLKMPRL